MVRITTITVIIATLITLTGNSIIAQRDDQTSAETTIPLTQSDLSVLIGNVQRPNGFVWLDNNLYAACNGDWTLYEIDSVTGATSTFVFGVRDANTLYAEETETGFNLWIPDFEQNQLVLVDETRSSPNIISEDLNGPWGIASIEDRVLAISNLRDNNIVYMDNNAEPQILIEGLRSPAGLAYDTGMLYVANNGSARRAIEWYDLSEVDFEEENNQNPDTISGDILVSGLQNVSNVVAHEDGLLYFTFALGRRGVVGRVNPDMCREETCTNDQVDVVIYTELDAPLSGLVITPDNRIFVHSIYRPEIYWAELPE